MSLEYAILGFLETEDLSGYDLKTKCFDEAASHFWTADQAQVYRTLDRLQRAKLVTSTRKRQSTRPDRKVYSITRAGREALADWLVSAQGLSPLRDPFLIQVYFSNELTDEALAELMRARREAHQSRLDSLRTRATAPGELRGAGTRTGMLRRMTLDAAMAHERSAIDWLDDTIDLLTEPEGAGSAQRRLFQTPG